MVNKYLNNTWTQGTAVNLSKKFLNSERFQLGLWKKKIKIIVVINISTTSNIFLYFRALKKNGKNLGP